MSDLLVVCGKVLVHECGHILRVGDTVTLPPEVNWGGFEGLVLGVGGDNSQCVVLQVIKRPTNMRYQFVSREEGARTLFHFRNLEPTYTALEIDDE